MLCADTHILMRFLVCLLWDIWWGKVLILYCFFIFTVQKGCLEKKSIYFYRNYNRCKGGRDPIMLPPCQQDLEYSNCIPYRGLSHFPPPTSEKFPAWVDPKLKLLLFLWPAIVDSGDRVKLQSNGQANCQYPELTLLYPTPDCFLIYGVLTSGKENCTSCVNLAELKYQKNYILVCWHQRHEFTMNIKKLILSSSSRNLLLSILLSVKILWPCFAVLLMLWYTQ